MVTALPLIPRARVPLSLALRGDWQKKIVMKYSVKSMALLKREFNKYQKFVVELETPIWENFKYT